MWGTGFGNAPTDYNPYSPNPAYGMAFMYEPLFGMNYAPQYPTGKAFRSSGRTTGGALME
jgi:hypothetical protein